MSNKCLQFDGSTGYVAIEDYFSTNPAVGSWTVSVVVQPTQFGGTRYIMERSGENSGAAINGFSLYLAGDGRIQFNLCSATANTYFLGPVLSLTKPTWIAMVRDVAAHKMYCYVNGVCAGEVSHPSGETIDPQVPISIGCNSQQLYFFKGMMDDIRFCQRALSAADISGIFANATGQKLVADSLPENLIWGSNCDDGAGVTLTDITGGFNGDLVGGVTWADGGIPFNTEHYLVKRGTTIIDYLLDPLAAKIAIAEDLSLLADGTYNYTLTPVSPYGVAGTASDALTLQVAGGVIQEYPAQDPTDLAAVPAAGGQFTLAWRYLYGGPGTMPDKFNIYYSATGTGDWIKDGELACPAGRFQYTTVKSGGWANGTTVYFKVLPQHSTFEKANSLVAHADAETIGPTVASPTMTITES